MKKYLLALLNLFICGIIVVLLLFPISEVLMPKRITGEDNLQRLITKGFYDEPDNTIDVLFLGDSNIYRSISPIVLWDLYGISSYVYGSPGQNSYISYYFLRDALKTQKPKTVVLNVDTLFSKTKIKSGSLAKGFDDMENLRLKAEVILNNDIDAPITEKVAYIFKVFRYHDRYKELNSDDFTYAYKKIHNSFKGLAVSTEIKPTKENNFNYLNKSKSAEMNENCKNYLDKIIDLCKEKNINLILVEAPTYKSWTSKRSKVMKEYADSKNVRFIDLNIEGIGLNWFTDTKDKGGHLNLYGATKTTKYFSNILIKEPEYINRKNDKNYKHWHDDSKIYHEEVDKYLKEYDEIISKKNK